MFKILKFDWLFGHIHEPLSFVHVTVENICQSGQNNLFLERN